MPYTQHHIWPPWHSFTFCLVSLCLGSTCPSSCSQRPGALGPPFPAKASALTAGGRCVSDGWWHACAPASACACVGRFLGLPPLCPHTQAEATGPTSPPSPSRLSPPEHRQCLGSVMTLNVHRQETVGRMETSMVGDTFWTSCSATKQNRVKC